MFPHHGEDGAQQRPAEDLRGLVAREAVAKLRHVAVAQPPARQGELCCNNTPQTGESHVSGRQLPGVVGFVSGRVVTGDPLAPLGGRLQLPVVDLVEEHLGELHDGLALFRGKVAELVLDKVVDPLFGEADSVKPREQGLDLRGHRDLLGPVVFK